MKAHGIIAKTVKKFKATTDSKHNLPVAENLLKQDLYLAVILDLYSRQVVGWAGP